MSDEATIQESLDSLTAGDFTAVDRLFPIVYDNLRRLAENYMQREGEAHTLSATALVHEAYLKLVGQENVEWKSRAHLLAVAAQAMRRILIDHARKRDARKRGDGAKKLRLEDALEVGADPPGFDLLALDQSLSRLQAEQPDKAAVVEMRFFGGLSYEEIKVVLGVSSRTVIRHWKYAQAWLYRDLRDAK